MYNETSLGLAMNCWLNMSPGCLSRSFIMDVIILLFETQRSSSAYPKDALDIAVRAVGIEQVNRCFKQALLDDSTIDDNLYLELRAFLPFFDKARPFLRHFNEEMVSDDVTKALARQLD